MKVRIKRGAGDQWLISCETKRNKQVVRKYSKQHAPTMSREMLADGIFEASEALAYTLGSTNIYADIQGDTR